MSLFTIILRKYSFICSTFSQHTEITEDSQSISVLNTTGKFFAQDQLLQQQPPSHHHQHRYQSSEEEREIFYLLCIHILCMSDNSQKHPCVYHQPVKRGRKNWYFTYLFRDTLFYVYFFYVWASRMLVCMVVVPVVVVVAVCVMIII